VTGFVPPGWPAGVPPPDNPDFERSAVTWLFEMVPADYLKHDVLRRHPIALAALARHHLTASVEGARNGYRTARSELGPRLPPNGVDAVLTAYRNEGCRLADAARAADLVERALHGEVFVEHISGGARSERPLSRAGSAGSRSRSDPSGSQGRDRVRTRDLPPAARAGQPPQARARAEGRDQASTQATAPPATPR